MAKGAITTFLADVTSPLRPYKYTDRVKSNRRNWVCVVILCLFIAIFTIAAVWQARSKPLKQSILTLSDNVTKSYDIIIDTFSQDDGFEFTLSCSCSDPRANPNPCSQTGVLPPTYLPFDETSKCASLFPAGVQWLVNGVYWTGPQACAQFNQRLQETFSATPFATGGVLMNPNAWASVIVELYSSTCWTLINIAIVSQVAPAPFWLTLESGFQQNLICKGKDYWEAVYARAPPPWGTWESQNENPNTTSYRDYFGCCLPEFCSFFNETSTSTIALALLGFAGTLFTVLVAGCGGLYRVCCLTDAEKARREDSKVENDRFEKGAFEKEREVEMGAGVPALRKEAFANSDEFTELNEKLSMLTKDLQKQEENSRLLQSQIQDLKKENKTLADQLSSQATGLRNRTGRVSPIVAPTTHAFPTTRSSPLPPIPRSTSTQHAHS